jgi:hypothetical protein
MCGATFILIAMERAMLLLGFCSTTSSLNSR